MEQSLGELGSGFKPGWWQTPGSLVVVDVVVVVVVLVVVLVVVVVVLVVGIISHSSEFSGAVQLKVTESKIKP